MLPRQSGLRQWVLTFPFPWRPRLAQDGALLSNLTRIFVETVHAFCAERASREGALGAKTGAVTAVQRTSSDLRLNPHLHVVALDGVWHEQGGELSWQGLGHLQTSEVGAVLFSTVRRIERHLRRRGLLGIDEEGADPDVPGDLETKLAASAVSGQTPGVPQWVSRLAPLEPHDLDYDKPLRASLDGFTLHTATRARAFHTGEREDETARHGGRTGKRRPLPGRDGRADRGAPPLTAARPPYWRSRVLRRQALGDEDDGPGCWVPQTA